MKAKSLDEARNIIHSWKKKPIKKYYVVNDKRVPTMCGCSDCITHKNFFLDTVTSLGGGYCGKGPLCPKCNDTIYLDLTEVVFEEASNE